MWRPDTARPTWSSPIMCSHTFPISWTSAKGCVPWSPTRRVSIEIPHLLRLIEGNEYDTIYHEHYSYLTLLTATACACNRRFDGGRHRGAADPRRLNADLVGAAAAGVEVAPPCARVLADEAAAGLNTVEGHEGFPARWRLHATTSSSSS